MQILIRLVRPQLWILPLLIVLGIAASAAEGLGIGMLIPLLDALIQEDRPAAASNRFVAALRRYGEGFGVASRLVFLAGTIFAFVVVKAVILSAYAALSAWFSAQSVHTLRCTLFDRLLDVDYGFLMRTDRGRLLNTLEGETWRTSEALTALSLLIIHACSILSLGVLLLLISWEMTLTVAAGVGFLSLLLRFATRRAARAGEAVASSYASLSERMIEALGGIRVIRLFGREAHERDRFRDASDGARRAILSIAMLTGMIQPMSEVLYVLLFLGVLIGFHGWADLGTLMAFLLLLYRLQPHVRGLDYHRVQFASLRPAIVEVAHLLQAADQRSVRSGGRTFEGLRERIILRDLSFHYGTDAERPLALSRLSCTFERNRTTAIVGGSGAGKSTLIALLFRIYDPTHGKILIDGVPLTEFELGSWRARLALAGQDAELMAESVRDNIAYGRPDAGPEAIAEAAREADAFDFIMRLPEGFDTRVGERGLQLSAGQRQRIGLARALLRRPDVLILDEATNALDSLSEEAIHRTLERLAGRLTLIVVAHRLSTARLADWTLVLNEGRLVEQGSPGELMAQEGLLARLWQMQTGALEGQKAHAPLAIEVEPRW